MKLVFPLGLLALTLAATTAAESTASSLSPSARRGIAFAEQRCAACHSVRANGSSSNPEAPPWDDIANRPGTTQATLRAFLRDSHNYPEAMNFRVDARRIRDLAAYIVTLRKSDYRPIM
jgi:mono/diheme cytochrome c family protein